MPATPTKPCSRCGNDEPGDLDSAHPDKWWCNQCIAESNSDYYERHRARINGKRQRKFARRTKELMGVVKNELPDRYTLIQDTTGQYKPDLTEFNRSEMRGLVEDAYAPEGSVWRADDGRDFKVKGKQLDQQRLVLIGESETV